MNNNTAIIIQARTSSTRLPNKVLIPFFNNKGCLELLIERLKQHINVPIIISTSTNNKDYIIEELAKKLNEKYFRGEETNVLKRFIDCAKYFGVNNIVRVCSDNPFLDVDDLKILISKPLDDYDYISYCINNTASIKTHYGLWAEKVSLNALERVMMYTSDKLYLEHVTNFIYSNERLFKCDWINRSAQVPSYPVRLTLDTKEDFAVLSQIYSEVIKNKLGFDKETIFRIISTNQNYQDSMNLQIIKNSK